MTGREQNTGRYDTGIGDVDLLAAVGDIAVRARPDDPEKVSQRRFDAVATTSEYEELPSARAIAMRLNLPWSGVLAAALLAPRARQQVLVGTQREDTLPYLTDRHVFFALKLVARQLDVETLTANEYARGLEAVERLAERRWRHAVPRRYPNVNQLRHWARTRFPDAADHWSELLGLAGMQPVIHRERQRNPPPTEYTMALLVAAFVHANGRWPTRNDAVAFATVSGTPLRTWKAWPSALAAGVDELRRTGGDPDAVDAALSAPGAPFIVPMDGIAGAPHRGPNASRPHHRRWSLANVVLAVAEFDRITPRSLGRAQSSYRTQLPDHPEWPSVSTVIKYGWLVCVRHAQTYNRRTNAR